MLVTARCPRKMDAVVSAPTRPMTRPQAHPVLRPAARAGSPRTARGETHLRESERCVVVWSSSRVVEGWQVVIAPGPSHHSVSTGFAPACARVNPGDEGPRAERSAILPLNGQVMRWPRPWLAKSTRHALQASPQHQRPPAGLMLRCGGIVGIVVLFVLLAPAVWSSWPGSSGPAEGEHRQSLRPRECTYP